MQSLEAMVLNNIFVEKLTQKTSNNLKWFSFDVGWWLLQWLDFIPYFNSFWLSSKFRNIAQNYYFFFFGNPFHWNDVIAADTRHMFLDWMCDTNDRMLKCCATGRGAFLFIFYLKRLSLCRRHSFLTGSYLRSHQNPSRNFMEDLKR